MRILGECHARRGDGCEVAPLHLLEYSMVESIETTNVLIRPEGATWLLTIRVTIKAGSVEVDDPIEAPRSTAISGFGTMDCSS